MTIDQLIKQLKKFTCITSINQGSGLEMTDLPVLKIVISKSLLQKGDLEGIFNIVNNQEIVELSYDIISGDNPSTLKLINH